MEDGIDGISKYYKQLMEKDTKLIDFATLTLAYLQDWDS